MNWFVFAATVLYASAAIWDGYQGRWWSALVWWGYASANVGVLMLSKGL